MYGFPHPALEFYLDATLTPIPMIPTPLAAWPTFSLREKTGNLRKLSEQKYLHFLHEN